MSSQKRTVRATDYNEGISIALKIADGLGLSLAEKALLFGVRNDFGEDLEYLERELRILKSQEIEGRCNLIFELQSRLDSVLGTNIEDQRHWIDMPHQLLQNRSVKSLLVTGDLAHLQQAVGFLHQISG